MFPIEYQGNDDLFADFFGDDDALSQFKLKNRNQREHPFLPVFEDSEHTHQ